MREETNKKAPGEGLGLFIALSSYASAAAAAMNSLQRQRFHGEGVAQRNLRGLALEDVAH